MPAADVTIHPSEQELVERWRAEALERAGYSAEDAAAIAARPDVDYHRAVDMLAQGCPADVAVRILL